MKRSIKTLRTLSFLAIPLLLVAGCSKYVDKKPLDEFSDLDYWNSEDNVKTFAWGFYNDLVIGYGGGQHGTNTGFYFGSFNDDQANASFSRFPKNAPASDDNWSFGDIRKSNLMIGRVNQMDLDQGTKNHWIAVARFFRAWNYYNLVQRFGDVPWYGKVLDISEDSAIY